MESLPMVGCPTLWRPDKTLVVEGAWLWGKGGGLLGEDSATVSGSTWLRTPPPMLRESVSRLRDRGEGKTVDLTLHLSTSSSQ